MNSGYFRTLIDYNYWARDKLLAAVSQVPDPEYFAARPMDYGTIHGTLVHAYAAEVVWHSRWLGTSPARMLNAADFPDRAALASAWRDREAQVRAFVGRLSDDDLAAVVRYQTFAGTPGEQLLWQTMAHSINHGTNHRSEVAATITQLGHSPGDLDLIVYFREHAGE